MAKVRDKIRIVLLLGLLFFAAAFKHPLYLSVTDLKYAAKEKAVQGSVKLFTNDIEGALKKNHGRTIDLMHPKDTLQAKQIVDAYLKKHLSITINGKAWPYVVHGFEPEEEAIWVYIELKSCPLPKRVEVENSLLYDLLSTQSNIVHIEVNGQKKSGKVDCPEKLLLFEF